MIRDILRDTTWHQAVLDFMTFLALGILMLAFLLFGDALFVPAP